LQDSLSSLDESYYPDMARWRCPAVFAFLVLLPRCAADCTPINALGSFNKAATTFYWDLVASRTVPLTGISVFFNGPDVPYVATDCSFSTKAESFQASTLSWTPLSVVWAEPFNNVPTLLFAVPPLLQANVTYSMNFACSAPPSGRYHSLKYSAEQWYGGRINVAANDGTLRLLAGGTGLTAPVRYFNGYMWYGSSCTPPPPAALPPPPPFVLPTLPSGAAYVATEAQLVAAVANAAVTDIVVAASFTLTTQLVINRTTLRSITGNTGACASADGPDTIWLDYDYSSRVTPFVTALPRMCTLSALTQFRHLSVRTGSLTLANLQFVNGWMSSSFHVSVAPGPGGAVFMSDATTAGCNSTLSVFNCSFAGNSATTNKGGAIAACNLVVDGSLFRENSAKFGGDLYIAGLARITNSQFNQSVALSSGFGGSIYLDNSVSNFLVRSPGLPHRDPPARADPRALSILLLQAMQPSYITNCSFLFDNTYGFTTVKALGGAIYTVLKAQPLVISNSYIGGYYAITGGGIYLTGAFPSVTGIAACARAD
jgi:predicted outer membrane repeat protein